MDLIRLEGEGNSVIVRITGKEDVEVLTGERPGEPLALEVIGETLTAELILESSFVRGSLRLWLSRDDLEAWLDVLDGLDGGHDALWIEDGRTPEITLARDEHDQIHFTVRDWVSSNTAVTLVVPITDAWFDDAYARLDQVWTTWPLAAPS